MKLKLAYSDSHDDYEIEIGFQQHHGMGVEPRRKI
jgi:hypothetical protein